jgi:hypothetical protein
MQNIFNGTPLRGEFNPFAEGGPSKKTRMVGFLHEWLRFSRIYFLPKNQNF